MHAKAACASDAAVAPLQSSTSNDAQSTHTWHDMLSLIEAWVSDGRRPGSSTLTKDAHLQPGATAHMQRTNQITIETTRHSPATILVVDAGVDTAHDRAGTRAQEDEEEIVGRGDVAEDGAEHQRQTNDEASVGHKDDVDLLDDASKRSSCFVDLQACAHTQTKCKSEQREDTPAGRATCTCFPNRYLVTVSMTSQRRQKDHVEVAGKPMSTCRG